MPTAGNQQNKGRSGPHSEFSVAPAHGALDPGDAHPVDDVSSEPEGYQLGRGKHLALLEGHPQVDVHHLRRHLVDENVARVAVPKPH
eukprot:2194616-Pyramimonas_sp.AAC.1